MADMESACEECTKNCIMMHKKDKKPEAVTTTFFKVMIGEDYDKVLFLPPKFSRCQIEEVPNSTWLEDSSNGEKWQVNISKVDGSMAFREGWDKFVSDHCLEAGDFLVFHYIKDSRFVVLMYGKSGCPELRHQMNLPKKNKNMNSNNRSPSNANSNGQHYLSESSSKFDCSRQKKKRSIKENDAMLPPDGNITNTNHLPVSLVQPGTLGSDIEKGQRSEQLVRKTNCDSMVCETQIATCRPDKEMSQTCEPLVCETGTTVKNFCKPDNDDENVDDEYRKTEPKANPYSTSQRCEPLVCETGTPVEQSFKPANDDANVKDEYRKTKPIVNPDSMSQRGDPLVCETGTTVKEFCKLNNDDANLDHEYRKTKTKVIPEESEGALKSKVEDRGNGEETQDDIYKRMKTNFPATIKRKQSTAMLSETTCNNSKKQKLGNFNITSKQMETMEKELVKVKETDTSGSRLHKGGTSSGISLKPTAKRMEGIKKEPTTYYDSGGLNRTYSGSKLKDTKRDCRNSPKVENDRDFLKVKPEPVDDDEAPSSIPTNTTFSAVMSSYKYIELPNQVKLKTVIFLRNGSDLWPVLFQSKFGLKALTQNWEVFAKERGIMLGDKCDFVLESDPNKGVFSVHISR
uniref:uncharacterized protein LOC122589254 n=1 Tax=Erigeron canadensis TaxID=72917 RepID=UPI001CB986E8|nr:uncharacterized protein LOC122589254 [Erigeron canadensis]